MNNAETQIKDYYDSIWSKPYPAVDLTLRMQAILARYVRRGCACIDVGCGNGQSGASWVEPFGCQYTGVDVSEVAVQQARAKGYNAIRVEDASHLPFPESSFDVALCTEVFEHLFAPHLAAAEIYRVLRAGGGLVVTVPNVAYWRRRFDLSLFGRWNPLGDELAVVQPWRDPHVRFFNSGALQRMLKGAGFRIVERSGHCGGLLQDVPYLGRWFQGRSSALYRLLESAWPHLLARHLIVVASKPKPGSDMP